MTSKRFILLVLFFLSITSSITGCIRPGTGTGNPQTPDDLNLIQSSNLRDLVRETCELVYRCRSDVTIEYCNETLLQSRALSNSLGIEEQVSIEEIFAQIATGVLEENMIQGSSCVAKLKELTCDSEGVASAYDPTEKDPFQGASYLLDPVCLNFFEAR